MNMNLSELINEILSEWAYRVDDGMPNPKNPIHVKELGIVLSEMGLSHIKNTLIENLLVEKGKTPEPVKEEEGSFSNPILNKKIKYKNTKGEDAEGFVGNLLRLPADHPGRKAAEALLPADGSPERDSLNKDLGGQGQAAKPEDGKDKEGGEAGGGEEDKAKAAQAMFEPKADPAMAARLDKEKEVQAQLAKDAEADKEAEKAQEPKKDNEFQPIDTKDVAKEMPQADPETFNGDSDIPDKIDPKQLEKFNTDIAKVAQQVADAKAKGEPAPNINLCDVTVPGTNLYCDDNLGIPRDEMPQFKGTAQPGSRAAGMEADASGEVDTEPVFREMLAQKGIKTLQTEVPADKLKATQKDLVGAKVVGMMGALEKDPQHPKITAPIYVSRDGYVIDGHHRWAAIVAYNAAHPDAPIPMKTTVLDMDIKDAIPMANKFAEDMGIAAKKADANKEDVPSEPTQREPANDDPESKAQQFKGKSSGENIQTMEMEGGGFVYGTKHGNTAMVDDILDDVKSKIPKERWKDVVFVGEGGATGDSGELEFNDEMDYAAPKFKEMGAGVDTWDGDEMDVHNDQSKLYQKQKEKTGFNDSQVKAGNWASMIGQGEGTDTMSPNDYLDDEGKQFLQDAAKEAGFPPIENWDEPTEQDKDTLYRLSFPEDNGDKPTKINDIQVAFNDIRDENLIEKNKELTAQGKIPITIAGESHVELVDKMTRKGEQTPEETPTEKLPEPEEPSTEDGGVVYSVGGGYYSDTPGGPAQYRVAEGIVEEVLIEGNESLAYLLFEAKVTKKTSRGKVVKLVTIDKSKQKKATAAAKAKSTKTKEPAPTQTPQPSADKESGRQEIDSPKTEQEKEKMRKFTDKSVTSSLQLTKSDVKAQEKQAKDEYEKSVKAWEKGGKKGPKPQFTKGLGAGSPESRAGESAVVKGCLTLRDEYVKCISKSKDKKGCYEKARAIARKKLESFLGADSYLTDEWIDSAMNTLDLIHEEIGFENIEEIGWDNQQGRALVGSQGHGTSADMFIKGKPTKQFPKGKRIGISLKKDLKVFVFNGGWAKLEKVVTDRGFKLSEKSTMEYYNKRRYEELEKIRNFAKENNADFCNDFENLKNNPNRISKKPQNVQSRVSDILKKTGKSDLSKVNCEDFINSIINERPPSVDSMKIIGDLCKTSTNTSLKDAYKRLRALDREMTDGIANDFMKPENQAVVKKLVRDETHISDILFADNPNLDELKVVFGTEPAISMKPEKLAELFGIQKLHEQYKNEKDPRKKAALRKKMEDIIDSKITINNKKGVMSVAITITDENGAESQLPLFEAKIRTRGFGNSPTFEMPQTVFGGLAYKYGHTRYNEWQDEDKEIVVSSAIKDIEDEFSEELEFLDDKTSAEILKRLKDLETIYPNSPALKKFKKKYLNSDNKSVQTAKEKAKAKKK